jgi:carbon monoxide dehydrogenase subunit G
VASVQESVDVDVPIRVAYDQWTQFESFPKFMGGVERITQLDDTRTHWVTNIDGVKREFDAEITEQHPEERVAWTSTGGEAKHAGVVTFHRLDDNKTRVMIQIDWEPTGIAEKAGAVLGFDDRQVKADAKRFKEFIESRGTETGAWRGDVPRPDQTCERAPSRRGPARGPFQHLTRTAPAPFCRGRAPSSVRPRGRRSGPPAGSRRERASGGEQEGPSTTRRRGPGRPGPRSARGRRRRRCSRRPPSPASRRAS